LPNAGISENSSAAAQSMLPSDSLGNHSKSLSWNRPALWMTDFENTKHLKCKFIFAVCNAIAMPMKHSPSITQTRNTVPFQKTSKEILHPLMGLSRFPNFFHIMKGPSLILIHLGAWSTAAGTPAKALPSKIRSPTLQV